MSIEIDGLSKQFGSFTALNRVSLSVETGEFVALLGPSGSGKTTLLRMIAGLEHPDAGRILVNGIDTQSMGVAQRGVGFVFQHYALFRHMTVFENVAFGLNVKPRRERLPASAIRDKVMSLLQLVQLDWLSDRFPDQLSGGQRQRIALARSLAVEPKLLLLDEPFGALDSTIRKELRQWLRRLHDQLGVTSVFVTHDVDEAMEMADRVAVLRHGVIEQVGHPDEVYHHPANSFVLQFIGGVNLFHGRMGEHGIQVSSEGTSSDQVTAFIRPQSVRVHIATDGLSEHVRATIKRMRHDGISARLDLVTEWGHPFEAIIHASQVINEGLHVGQQVAVTFDHMMLGDYSI